jgi:hypothetical protein
MPRPRPASQRFWEKVEKTRGCWLWKGAVSGSGYGSFRVGAGVMISAHHFAYRELVGPVPEGLTIDHTCRNRLCVKPAHLEVVTMGENVRRGGNPAAHNARKTHCKRGHEFTPENTRISGRGRRICLACERLYRDEHREELRVYWRERSRRRSRKAGVVPWAEKTHCPNGHAYTPANSYIYRGRRLCRECRKMAHQRLMERKRGDGVSAAPLVSSP